VQLKARRNKAFTLIELLNVVALVAIILAMAMIFAVVCMGNFYVTESGVLKEIQILDPEVTEVMTYHASVQKPSIFRVKKRDGAIAQFAVESNILFNYRIKPVDDKK